MGSAEAHVLLFVGKQVLDVGHCRRPDAPQRVGGVEAGVSAAAEKHRPELRERRGDQACQSAGGSLAHFLGRILQGLSECRRRCSCVAAETPEPPSSLLAILPLRAGELLHQPLHLRRCLGMVLRNGGLVWGLVWLRRTVLLRRVSARHVRCRRRLIGNAGSHRLLELSHLCDASDARLPQDRQRLSERLPAASREMAQPRHGRRSRGP
mmetsp:Transcript_125199/g.365647  ORF Transcript_125199/g.365647 Transcript_125199/m.365647 type:complete len:209 (-) Transcript_125199:59-685(-)